MITRQDIVAESRTWLGTRFHHQGRVKKTDKHKGGCDCIGLIVGIVRDLQLKDKSGKMLSEYDITDYSHLPDGRLLEQALSEHLSEISTNEVQSGDVLLFKFEKDPQHVGIISDYYHGGLGIIHCYAGSRKVVEHSLDKTWQERIVRAFKFYGV